MIDVWTVDSRWFDVAALTTLLVVLTVAFDRFERHKPAWRRVSKIAVLVALVLVVIEAAGRAWGYGVLVLILAAGMAVHFVVLSRVGVNGWTGEPHDRLDALLHEIERRGEARTLWALARPRRQASNDSRR